jgi:hypothetical protein
MITTVFNASLSTAHPATHLVGNVSLYRHTALEASPLASLKSKRIPAISAKEYRLVVSSFIRNALRTVEIENRRSTKLESSQKKYRRLESNPTTIHCNKNISDWLLTSDPAL